LSDDHRLYSLDSVIEANLLGDSKLCSIIPIAFEFPLNDQTFNAIGIMSFYWAISAFSLKQLTIFSHKKAESTYVLLTQKRILLFV